MLPESTTDPPPTWERGWAGSPGGPQMPRLPPLWGGWGGGWAQSPTRRPPPPPSLRGAKPIPVSPRLPHAGVNPPTGAAGCRGWIRLPESWRGGGRRAGAPHHHHLQHRVPGAHLGGRRAGSRGRSHPARRLQEPEHGRRRRRRAGAARLCPLHRGGPEPSSTGGPLGYRDYPSASRTRTELEPLPRYRGGRTASLPQGARWGFSPRLCLLAPSPAPAHRICPPGAGVPPGKALPPGGSLGPPSPWDFPHPHPPQHHSALCSRRALEQLRTSPHSIKG